MPQVSDLLKRFAPEVGGRLWYNWSFKIGEEGRSTWFAATVTSVNEDLVDFVFSEGPQKDNEDTCVWAYTKGGIWVLNNLLRYDVRRVVGADIIPMRKKS